jgi:hypothetical protein
MPNFTAGHPKKCKKNVCLIYIFNTSVPLFRKVPRYIAHKTDPI